MTNGISFILNLAKFLFSQSSGSGGVLQLKLYVTSGDSGGVVFREAPFGEV